MIQTCKQCNRLLEEGDKVRVTVLSNYHVLKSTIAYALDKGSLTALSETLEHQNCQFPKGEFENV